MAITLAQSIVTGLTSGPNTVAGTFGSNTTTGNTIVAIASGYNSTNTVSVASVSMTGGTFTKVIGINNSFDMANLSCVEIWVAPNITGGVTPTVTATFAVSGGNFSVYQSVFIMELAGMPATLTTDGTAASNTGTGLNPTTPLITTAGTNDIIIVACAPHDTATGAASPFNTHFVVDSTQTGNAFSYEIVSSAQTNLDCVFTQPNNATYQTVIAALQGSSGGGSISPTVSGTIAVTGIPVVTLQYQTNLSGTSLITGLVSPLLGISPTLTPGSIGVSGQVALSLGLPPLTGAIGITGTVNTGAVSPSLSGSINIAGSVSPTITPIFLTLSGSIGVHGSVTNSWPSGGQKTVNSPWYLWFD